MDVLFEKIRPDAHMPERAYPTDSGADLRYCGDEPIEIPSAQMDNVVVVPTGLRVKLPAPTYIKELRTCFTWEMQIRSKSGLAAKRKLMVLNSPGTIDSSYTGEIKVILCNLSSDTQVIKPGNKIAQAVICPVVTANFEEVARIDDTSRGQNGFGHTGV